jgi:hypothetical protein
MPNHVLTGGNSGKVFLMFGKSDGWEIDTSFTDVDASYIGIDFNDLTGSSVSGAGDVNGDGYDDILIGAPSSDDDGKVYLILGKESGWALDTDLTNAEVTFIGETGKDGQTGTSVSGAGDVNGDGYDDFLIGAPGYNGGIRNGKVYLIWGNGDGWGSSVDLSTVDTSFLGEADGDEAGSSVSIIGDVNGDGYEDMLIGAPDNAGGGTERGQTYLILGKSSGWTTEIDLSTSDASYLGEGDHDDSGRTVSGKGDINGDGYDDFLIAAYRGANTAGQTYLILGKPSGWAMNTNLAYSDASFLGENNSDFSGHGSSISIVGDVNKDGFDDILIGAKYNDDAANGAGKAYLIFGESYGWEMNTSLADSEINFLGDEASDYAGWSVSGAGDVNDDGTIDMIVSTKGSGSNIADSDKVYLILGKQVLGKQRARLDYSGSGFVETSKNDGSVKGSIVATLKYDTYTDDTYTTGGVSSDGVAQGWNDDDAEWSYDLPFTFTFYDTDYDSIKIGSNGVICFGEESDCTWLMEDIDGNFEPPFIQPMGVDLVTEGVSQVDEDIYITENQESVVIRWQAEDYDSNDPINFEATLYSNGDIKFSYGDQPNAPLTNPAQIGVGLGDGISYTESQYSGGKVFDNVTSVIFQYDAANSAYVESLEIIPGDGVLDIPSEVIVGNIPEGLSPVVTLSNGDTVATLTLEGKATKHVNDVLDITFEFQDGAFTKTALASNVTNATGPASSNKGIDFNDTVETEEVNIIDVTTQPTTEDEKTINIEIVQDEDGTEFDYIVQDEDGNPINGITISIPELGLELQTDGEGRLDLSGIELGSYNYEFNYMGTFYTGVIEILASEQDQYPVSDEVPSENIEAVDNKKVDDGMDKYWIWLALITPIIVAVIILLIRKRKNQLVS